MMSNNTSLTTHHICGVASIPLVSLIYLHRQGIHIKSWIVPTHIDSTNLLVLIQSRVYHSMSRTWIMMWCIDWIWRLCQHSITWRSTIYRCSTELSHCYISAINITCFIDILKLFSIVFVVPHITFIVIWVTNSVQFCIKSFFNFLFRLNEPFLLQFTSQLKIHLGS